MFLEIYNFKIIFKEGAILEFLYEPIKTKQKSFNCYFFNFPIRFYVKICTAMAAIIDWQKKTQNIEDNPRNWFEFA